MSSAPDPCAWAGHTAPLTIPGAMPPLREVIPLCALRAYSGHVPMPNGDHPFLATHWRPTSLLFSRSERGVTSHAGTQKRGKLWRSKVVWTLAKVTSPLFPDRPSPPPEAPPRQRLQGSPWHGGGQGRDHGEEQNTNRKRTKGRTLALKHLEPLGQPNYEVFTRGSHLKPRTQQEAYSAQ